jgi:hypothetical protein
MRIVKNTGGAASHAYSAIETDAAHIYSMFNITPAGGGGVGFRRSDIAFLSMAKDGTGLFLDLGDKRLRFSGSVLHPVAEAIYDPHCSALCVLNPKEHERPAGRPVIDAVYAIERGMTKEEPLEEYLRRTLDDLKAYGVPMPDTLEGQMMSPWPSRDKLERDRTARLRAEAWEREHRDKD